jgi:hypothetical protein
MFEPGPACRCPTSALSLSLSSSITPRPLPPGPASPRSCPSATLTPSPVSPTPIALPYSCSPHHPCHPRSSPSPIQPLPAAPSFPPLHQPPSPPSPSSTWTRPSRPPFSLSLLHPARPPILRSHRCPIALFSMPFTRARAPSPSLPMLQAREALSGTGHCATPPVWEPPLPPPRPHGELRLPWVFLSKFPPLLTSPLFTGAPGAGHHLHRPTQLIADPRNVVVLSRLDHPSVALPPRCVPTGTTLPVISPFSHLSYSHRCLHTLSPGWTPVAAPPQGVPCAVTTRCARHAASTSKLGHPFGLGQPSGAGCHDHYARGLGPVPAQNYARVFKSFSIVLNSRIVSKF